MVKQGTRNFVLIYFSVIPCFALIGNYLRLCFKVLYKLWPSINHFARELCKQSIEPAIVEKLAEYKVKGFQFKRLVLGRIVS